MSKRGELTKARGGGAGRAVFALILLLVCCLWLPTPAAARQRAEDLSIAASDKVARESARRGEELRRKGQLDPAETAFRKATALDPANLEASLGLAQIARAKLDYAGALALLGAAKARHPGSASLLAESGLLYLAAEDPARALGYFEAALKLDPTCAAAIIGRAGVDLLERNYKSAQSRLGQYLAANPQNSAAHAWMGRTLLESNQNREAENSARRALALDPINIDALSVLAFVKATERKPVEVRDFARRALALDPLNPGMRRLLAQYLDGQKGYQQKIAEPARNLYERGYRLRQAGKLDEAVAQLEAALRIEPSYYRALIALGDIWLREGDYERAAAAARLAISVDPDGALAHLELSYSNWGLQERERVEIGATDFSSTFYREDGPKSSELINQIFPNYKALPRPQQIVIDRAVSPLAHYLPKLARSGARHYLLPYDQRVSDVEEFTDVADEKTFDGRYYASVRGVGGRITVSGIEYIDMAARGGFHTIAHEFAHQVHMAAMGKEEARAIRRLYERALREKRALDFYAAANEYEYFAQGYEAFISSRKRPSAGVTARHTREELALRDPDLYRFLIKLTAPQPADPAQVF